MSQVQSQAPTHKFVHAKGTLFAMIASIKGSMDLKAEKTRIVVFPVPGGMPVHVPLVAPKAYNKAR